MSHSVAPAFAHTSGPKDAKLVLVGEAFGEQEDLVGKPFIGASGQELTRLLEEAGIDRRECLLTNVFAFRPYQGAYKSNQLDLLCAKKADLPADYSAPALSQGKYIRPEFLPELARLKEELEFAPRNLIIALGSSACWALLGRGGIGTLRGTTTHSTLCPGLKILPTYHPSYLFKMWENRPIVLADLMKAKRESAFPEIRRPERWVLVNPTLDEIEEWMNRHVRGKELDMLSLDVETGAGQITHFGVAVSPAHAMSIPFVDKFQPDFSYWPTPEKELRVWNIVREVCSHPAKKLFQNGLYDLQYLLQSPAGAVVNCEHDSMLLHHAFFPELQKGLGFMGSIYTNESSWKLLRHKAEEKGDKRDE